MKSASVTGCVLAGCCLGLSVHTAGAQESPLGLYVGAGVGTATVRQGPEPGTGYYGLSQEDFGWNAFIGVRPIPYLGAEIGYLDFGDTDRFGYYGSYFPADASAHGPVGFAVGYLPLNPWWDLYLKAGAADLYKAWNFSPGAGGCPAGVCSAPPSYAGSATQWDFAWGVGTQWKWGPTALRLEYQRVETGGNTNPGDPDLLSVGVSWTFF